MQPSSDAPRDDGRGLPPVEPPSAGHIVKLFVVPLVIVGFLVGLVWVARSWLGSPVMRSPEAYLRDLRSDNWDVRWRAAQDLAQVLLRDDWLASDPAFGLQLVEELRRALAESTKLEEKAQAAGPEPPSRELTASRDYILFLTSCLSNLSTPVGVPVLKELAREGGSGPDKVRLTRRWRALWSLANLGENLRRFDRLPAERREAVAAEMSRLAEGGGPEAETAARARDCLQARLAGRPDAMGVDEVLVAGMSDKNPFLREVAAFASNFWTGDRTAEQRLEESLRERLEDTGGGEERMGEFYEGLKIKPPPVPRAPGLRVRYNAAVALARRGSKGAPLDLLAEMLDLKAQREQNRRITPDGREEPDEAAVQETVLTALRAVAELHRKNPAVNLAPLEGALDQLRKSDRPALRQEAERTWAAVDGSAS